jgi:hypothetical protein
MDDVQVVFGILTHCFVQWASYILCCIFFSSTLIDSFAFFDFSLFQVFGHLLGLRSFDSPKGTLTYK